ncbi:MAG: polymerase [Candidatus Adlerbacteria bacterium]|nr:polymerase [Candidatus Adlerbacteria bacterium]
MKGFSDRSFPKAILHFDGDSFFASVEQAMNYKLRGKPIVTGAERGAATALSIEAKRLGLNRGMSMKDIRAKCPEVIVVSSDYTSYSVYARRMYAIVRRYTSLVEEYSIDECFADITGLRPMYGMRYEEIALMIKSDLERSLGITFGVGLGPSKVVAKIGSKFRKPGGFTPIPAKEVQNFLKDIPVGNLWGVGFAQALKLQNLGIVTALDFAQKDEAWLRAHHIAKPYREIWYELRGGSARELATEHRGSTDIGSIIKTRTFSPPSPQRAFVLAQLSKNIERACFKARKHGVKTGAVGVMLKTQDFLYRNAEVPLPVPTNDPAYVLKHVQKHFDRMFVPNILYRATGISLRSIVGEKAATLDLFGETLKVEENSKLLDAVDGLNKRYGKETIGLALSLKAVSHHEPDRQRQNSRRTSFVPLPIEQRKKTIDLPFLGMAH